MRVLSWTSGGRDEAYDRGDDRLLILVDFINLDADGTVMVRDDAGMKASTTPTGGTEECDCSETTARRRAAPRRRLVTFVLR